MLRVLRTKVENRPFVDEMGIKPQVATCEMWDGNGKPCVNTTNDAVDHRGKRQLIRNTFMRTSTN